jgi:scyllo-inositol 2-dehydrogenase (NADP+)
MAVGAAKTGKQKIRVGVIGYGGAFSMGKIHLTDMRAAGMVPTAVAELDPARRAAATQDFPGIETYASVKELLARSSVDLVTIITPHNTHAPLALQCLKAGRHVVCEKPMALTTAECDAMIDAAKAAGVMLSTYHNRHWDGWIMNAMRHVRGGAIGEVVRVDAHMGQWGKPGDWWRSSRSISGGILYDWGVHVLEYTLQLIDAEITEVAGYAKAGVWASSTAWKKDTIEDEGWIVVRYASGAWSSLLVTSLDAAPRQGWVHVTGTKGSFEFDGQGWTMTTPSSGRGKSVTTVKGTHPPSQWPRFYANIAAHLTKGQALVITPEWARRPIHIIDLANRSAAKGAALKAKYG